MASSSEVEPRFRGWRGWQAQPLVPGDATEYRLTLGMVRGRLVAAELEVRDPITRELLGVMSHPGLGAVAPQEVREALHQWVDEALSQAREWDDPFR